jgi:beta-lactamase regulating signal transducer with metallopeptidase domain
MQTLLEFGLSNAIMATVLAAVAACVARLCRRPAVVHALWLLVLLKLVTPPLIRIPMSWPMPRDVAEAAPTESPAMKEGLPEDSGSIQVAMASPGDKFEAEVLALLLQEAREQQEALRQASVAEIAVNPPVTEEKALWKRAIQAAPPWLAGLWLSGSVVWFAVAIIRIRRFQSLLRLGYPAPESIQREVHTLAARMDMRQVPEIWFVPGRISPLLWALGGNARLVVPEDLWRQLEPEPRSTLLAHELAHARRRDHWTRWLEFVSLGLYWWHPVAWWARHELQQAEEQCCDAWVVHTFPWAGKAYARALLKTVSFLDSQPAVPPVASGAGHVQSLKRRLNMIVRTPLSPRAPWFVNASLLLAGLAILPVTPLRLDACNMSGGPIMAGRDDDEKQNDSRQDRIRELERRIRGLEDRLDRVLRKLETQKESGREGETKRFTDEVKKNAEDQMHRAEEMMRDAKRRAEEQVRHAEQRAREMAQQAERRAREATVQAERLATEARRRAEEQVQRAQEKIRSIQEQHILKLETKPEGKEEHRNRLELQFSPDGKAEKKHVLRLETKDDGKPGTMKRHRIIIDGQVLDSETLENLHKQIEEGIRESINPERLKKMEKTIEETVQKNIDPKRLEQLDREIERAVKQNLNPQRMEALAKQIESAVGRSLKDAERHEHEHSLEHNRTLADKKLHQNENKSTDKSTAQLEKRLDKLEKQMDKVLRALESSQNRSH